MSMVSKQLRSRVEALERVLPSKPVRFAFFSSRDEVHPELGKTIEQLENDPNYDWHCWYWDDSKEHKF